MEHTTENRWRYIGPVEATGIQQFFSHVGIERWQAQIIFGQGSVHMWKIVQVFIGRLGSSASLWRIQRLAKLRDPASKVGSVNISAALNQFFEDATWFENAGVVREQVENDPDKKPLKIVTCV